MAKFNYQPNPQVKEIFEDLEKYLEFCKDYGYVFDESTLYDMKSYAYRQYSKTLSKKQAKDNWEDIIVR